MPRIPGQRAGLDRDRVLAAARELLADRGLEGVTMRTLADRLGVMPNALYSHVDSKTALLDELLDDVLAEVHSPGPDAAHPERALHALMASTHDVLLSHADLVPVYLARQGARGANAQRLGEDMLALLEREGVTGARAREAMRVLIIYTIGFAAFATRPLFEPDATTKIPAGETRANFERGLQWLLAGIVAD